MVDNGFDFKECDFINSEMKFYSYEDFCINGSAIKRLYKNNLSKYGKIFYKWYLYSNVYITINQKNKIWDYMNDFISKEELMENKNGYRIKK